MRPRLFFGVLTLLAGLLAACAPSAVVQPRPTPWIGSLQRSTTLQNRQPALAACLDAQPETGWIVEEAAVQSMAYQSLSLRWGARGLEERIAGGEIRAFTFGTDELVVITHPQNPLERIGLDDLRNLYTSSASSDLQPWTVSESEDLALVFSAILLGGEPASRQSAWLAPDAAAMREAVAANPQAVGYLPRSWLDRTVKAVAVDGLEPAAMQQPLLALKAGALTAEEETLLLCLQTGP